MSETSPASESTAPATERTTAAGWYDNPHASGLRYYDGKRWLEAYAPPPALQTHDPATLKDLL